MQVLRRLAQLLARCVGAIFIVLAILQWATFDYPNINPFVPGAIFAPGMLSQLVNFAIVIGLVGIGIGFFWLSNFIRKDQGTS